MADNYMNSADKAQDNRSSGWTLLLVGGVGLIALLLAALGIIPLPMSGFSKIMSMCVLGTLCIVFIIMGIVSFQKSKEYAFQAQAEGDKESEVINWFLENCPGEKIDEALAAELDDLSEEEIYFKRFALVRQILFNRFKDSGEAFLNHMADEVYEVLFEEE